MEIIRTQSGKNKGRINVSRALASMDLNEIWETSVYEVNADYTRSAACKISRLQGKGFRIIHTLEMKGQISVKRTR